MIAQLGEMSHLSRPAILRRATETDKARRLERETLIALVRGYLRAGDRDAADAVLDRLVKRLRSAIRSKIASWGMSAPTDREDAESEAVLKIIGYVSSLTPTEEMWECNFAHCFNQRMTTILHALTRRPIPTASLTNDRDGNGGEGRDGLAELPDTRAQSHFKDIEAREAIAALCRQEPKLGPYLYLLREEWTDEQIAAHLHVTTRTLRNWKVTARQFLAPHV